jgi:hypothetical protein
MVATVVSLNQLGDIGVKMELSLEIYIMLLINGACLIH